ncbi:dihydrofolate reductase family protein [Streptomyces tsukubensis]|uniref:Deaminase n=1 Tax=Streptomyces tsukubensis TaxID=83656 RepID=A0A1V4AF30_9ACTN|nr:dihydrofolate reductase family protein [Streptomyces tsukubensis]OON82161.1 deaminase [Streptomyces tsukubensis]QFR92647.1 dihydrofolate reductase [Streptomyces tsukubensis]
MRLTLTTFLTLDGVYQGPGGPDEDPEGGFTSGGWSVPYGDQDFGAFATAVFDRADAFLLGRRTYDIFAAHWPKVTDPADPIASRLNSLPKYVATTGEELPEWTGTTRLGRNTEAEVATLKARPGRELQIHGSGALAASLLAAGLVDSLNLLVFPVAVGAGKRLFTGTTLPTAFRLQQSTTTSRGVVISTYEREGAPTFGSYALTEE